MKKIRRIPVLFLMLLMVVDVMVSASGSQEESPQETSDYAIETLNITSDYVDSQAAIVQGIEAYSILLPDQASEELEFAASELNYFLAEITGITLPIIYESTAADILDKWISIGNTTIFEASGYSLDGLKDDSSVVKSYKNSILLYGGSERGATYAVYNLLEYWFSLKIYTPDCYTYQTIRANSFVGDKGVQFDNFTGEVAGESFNGVRVTSSTYQPHFYFSETAVSEIRNYASRNSCDTLTIHAYANLTNNNLVFNNQEQYDSNKCWVGPAWKSFDVDIDMLTSNFDFWSQSEGTTEIYLWFEFTKDVTEGTVPFEELDLTSAPAVEHRTVGMYLTWYTSLKQRRRMRVSNAEEYMNALGHSFATLMPPWEYYSAHPEWYSNFSSGSNDNWQLCLSNADMRAQLVKNVKETLKKDAEKGKSYRYFSISQNDGGGFCTCDNCKALNLQYSDSDSNYSGACLALVNEVANACAAEYPDIIFYMLAYTDATDIPPTKNITAASNVGVMYAPIDESSTYSYFENSGISSDNNGRATWCISGWKAICNHMMMWSYSFQSGDPMVPMNTFDSLAANSHGYVTNDFEVVFDQGSGCILPNFVKITGKKHRSVFWNTGRRKIMIVRWCELQGGKIHREIAQQDRPLMKKPGLMSNT